MTRDDAENAYPTREQMAEMFNAWKEDGKAGILRVLEKRRLERAVRDDKGSSADPAGRASESD